jgi:Glycosyl transferase family 8
MNLIYCCVFYNRDYLKLLELLLTSMKIYSSQAFEILVLTSPDFQNEINSISEKLGLKINMMFINLSTIFEAACARLRIFDYPDISNYETILYLDTDIIIKGDLAPVFPLATEERLYGIEEASIGNLNFGRQFFNVAKTDFSIIGINSGTLLFKNCLTIRDLFSRMRGHIAAFTDSGAAVPYTMDQPFINYHAIKDGLYDNKALNPFVSLYEKEDEVKNYATSVICHFSFPIGNFAHKYYRMKMFFIKLLNDTSSEQPLENEIVGKSYKWGDGFIKFNETGIETTWGSGVYTLNDLYTVSANWSGFYHILRFNHDYTSFISIRISPADCIIGYHTIL